MDDAPAGGFTHRDGAVVIDATPGFGLVGGRGLSRGGDRSGLCVSSHGMHLIAALRRLWGMDASSLVRGIFVCEGEAP